MCILIDYTFLKYLIGNFSSSGVLEKKLNGAAQPTKETCDISCHKEENTYLPQSGGFSLGTRNESWNVPAPGALSLWYKCSSRAKIEIVCFLFLLEINLISDFVHNNYLVCQIWTLLMYTAMNSIGQIHFKLTFLSK